MSHNNAFQLYCFASAGGDANAFTRWKLLNTNTFQIRPVVLPGHGNRLRDPAYIDLPELVNCIIDTTRFELDAQFGFFGHSFGAILAFEVAQHLSLLGRSPPAVLFASACSSPSSTLNKANEIVLTDEGLIALVGSLGGTPPEVLNNRELMKLVLPALRADLTMVKGYRYLKRPALTFPIVVLAGKRDQHVSFESLRGWAGETASWSSINWFAGGHFFMNDSAPALIEFISHSIGMIPGNTNSKYPVK